MHFNLCNEFLIKNDKKFLVPALSFFHSTLSVFHYSYAEVPHNPKGES